MQPTMRIEIRQLRHRAKKRDFICAVTQCGTCLFSRMLGSQLSRTEIALRVLEFTTKWSGVIYHQKYKTTIISRCEDVLL